MCAQAMTQEAAAAAGRCVGEEGEETPFSPLLWLFCPSHQPLGTSVPSFNEKETPGRRW